MSRSCFQVRKWIENPPARPVARLGRYYFLADDAQFIQRSGLGGHWFEGRPFQTGHLATSNTHPVTWVDGSTNFPVGWPDIHCCCGLWPEFTPTATWIKVTIPGVGEHEDWAYATGSVFGTILARFQSTTFGDRYQCYLQCPACTTQITSYPCNLAGSSGSIFLEDDQADDYMVSCAFSGVTLSHWTTGLCYAGCSALVRFYGTPAA